MKNVVQSIKKEAGGEVLESLGNVEAFVAVPIKKNHFGVNQLNMPKFLNTLKKEMEEVDENLNKGNESEEE